MHPLDLEPFRLGGADDRARGRRVGSTRRAATPASCMVTGHGVRPRRATRCSTRSPRSSTCPLAEKRAGRWPTSRPTAATAGSARRASRTAGASETPPDLFEAFNVGGEDTDGPYYDAHRRVLRAERVARPARPTSDDAWRAYERAVTVVADTLLRAMAIALDLPEAWFVERCGRAIITTRAINYEHAAGPTAPLPEARCAWARTPTTASSRSCSPTRSRAPGLPRRRVARRGAAARHVRVQHRRHARPLDQRPVDVDAAPGGPGRARPRSTAPCAGGRGPLPRLRARPRGRVHPVVHRCRQPAALRAGARRRLAAGQAAPWAHPFTCRHLRPTDAG